MATDFVAKAATTIDAPVAKVWDALVNPELIREYMFGTNVVSDWKEGSPITWKGEWEGKPYEDQGVILKMTPERVLQYSHNDHTVTIELDGDEERTAVTLSQDKNATEEAREHSEKNWTMMLDGLKKLVEG